MTNNLLNSNLEIIYQDEKSTRADIFLTKSFPNLSRSFVQKLFQQGKIKLRNTTISKKYLLRLGDTLQISPPEAPPAPFLQPQNIPLKILFEDESILVLNKQPNLVMHPGAGNHEGTLAHALLHHYQRLPNQASLRPGLVHRLDKNTTGVLVVAKTEEALLHLQKQFAERNVKKLYLVLTSGLPKEGLCDFPIKRHPSLRNKMCVHPQGKIAKSIVKVIKTNNAISLVYVQILTGRTHQVRIHLKELNAPVLGDTLYAKTTQMHQKAKRPLLHAYTLEIDHPISQKKMKFIAPIPLDMKIFIDVLG